MEASQSAAQYLDAKIEDSNLSKRDLARIVGLSYPHLVSVLRGKKLLTIEMAVLLARALDTDMSELLTLVVKEIIQSYIRDKRDILNSVDRMKQLHKIYPIGKLIDYKMISDTNDLSALQRELRDCFGLGSLGEVYQAQDGKLSSTIEFMLIKNMATRYNVGHYKFDLKHLIDNVFEYVAKPNGVTEFIGELLKHGVIFLYVPKKLTPGKDYFGAMFLSKLNPVLAYFNDKDSVDHFWYAAMHLLSHIVNYKEHVDIVDSYEYFEFLNDAWKLVDAEGKVKEVQKWYSDPSYLNPNKRHKIPVPHTFLCSHKCQSNAVESKCESAADDFVKEVYRCGLIEDTYRENGYNVDLTVDALPTIPKPIIYGYFKWFKARLRNRKFGTSPTFRKVYDNRIADLHLAGTNKSERESQ